MPKSIVVLRADTGEEISLQVLFDKNKTTGALHVSCTTPLLQYFQTEVKEFDTDLRFVQENCRDKCGIVVASTSWKSNFESGNVPTKFFRWTFTDSEKIKFKEWWDNNTSVFKKVKPSSSNYVTYALSQNTRENDLYGTPEHVLHAQNIYLVSYP